MLGACARRIVDRGVEAHPSPRLQSVSMSEPSRDERVRLIDGHLRKTEEVVTLVHYRFEIVGSDLIKAKILDRKSHTVREITVDAKTGRLQDLEMVRDAATRRWHEMHGALLPELVAKLATLGPGRATTVVVKTSPEKMGPVHNIIKTLGARSVDSSSRLIQVQAFPDTIRAGRIRE